MKVIGLDNKEYLWNFTKYSTPSSNPSSLHLRARLLLKTMFPYDIIFEELYLIGTKTMINNKILSLDLYINSIKTAFEIQGQQHSQYVPFFHGNQLEFFRSKRLDELKRQWCQINNIRLVELPYNLSDKEWEKLIKG